MSELKEMPLVELKAKDLPAYCPNPSMPRWSNHPRVFIDVTHGEAKCPYCSTRYKLKEGEVVHGHWTVLVDPVGRRYCVTDRDPSTGLLP